MPRQDGGAGTDRFHQEIWELLPWYGNGTLEGRELQVVKDHLATCTFCQEEVTRLSEVGTAIHAAEDVALSPQPGQFSRLMARIEAAEALREQGGGWWGVMHARVIEYRSLLNATPGVARLALIAQFALILLLLGVIVWQSLSGRGPEYRTLSDVTAPMQQGRVQISVVFAEDISEREMRELLATVGGNIIKGPSPLGVYTVDLPLSQSSPDPIGALLDHFRSHRKVRLAEPILAR